MIWRDRASGQDTAATIPETTTTSGVAKVAEWITMVAPAVVVTWIRDLIEPPAQGIKEPSLIPIVPIQLHRGGSMEALIRIVRGRHEHRAHTASRSPSCARHRKECTSAQVVREFAANHTRAGGEGATNMARPICMIRSGLFRVKLPTQ